MVDPSECFDMVPHDKLLEKLYLYGIDSFWLKNYIKGHAQRVQVTNNALGSVSRYSIREDPIGVYREGSMSCILWIIFANALALCFVFAALPLLAS